VRDSALVNLATALEDAERVTVATAAPSQGKQVVSWATKEAVRLGLPRIAGATPVWEWAGNDTTVFSY
jgi:hypothetical protein